ncbi:hypothetical protein ACFOOK_26370 [Micromonospora krabiensis]|uniref:Uncharacterized protein n=1 Tax=Micromonospora krabiensis TaxID=307121 RepID=A0A1C3N5Q0_9ACTN|nr:hypothetical protein [Micromonospora krabiensis]SBV27907.1 hypothetical protein GA0070620_3438 [Micromonospora krabiensis]
MTTTINFDLLDAAIEDAANEDGDFQHYQGEWATVMNPQAGSAELCETGLCLAGFAAVREGATVPKPRRYSNESFWWIPRWWVDEETGQTVTDGEDLDGTVHVSEFARQRLGLAEWQSKALFSSSNTLDDLRRMRDHLREHPNATYTDLIALSEDRDCDCC